MEDVVLRFGNSGMLLSRHLVKITNNTADNPERAEREAKHSSKGPPENVDKFISRQSEKHWTRMVFLKRQHVEYKYWVMSSFGLKPLAFSTRLLEK